MKGLKSARAYTAWRGFGLVLRPMAALVSKLAEGSAYSDIYDAEGQLYMQRIWLFGKKPESTGSESALNIRIHRVFKDDSDRATHSHPWWCVSLILKGGYWEIMPVDPDAYERWAKDNCLNSEQSGKADLILKEGAQPYTEELFKVWRGPGSLIFRPANSRHRLMLEHGQPCTSFFITGRKRQAWGFFGDKGFQYWRTYLGEWAGLSESEGFKNAQETSK